MGAHRSYDRLLRFRVRHALAAGTALAVLPIAAIAHPVLLNAGLTQPAYGEDAARAETLRQIDLANALPRSLRRQRLLVLARTAQQPDSRLAYAAALAASGVSSPGALAQFASASQTSEQGSAPVLATLPPPLPAPPPFADPAATLAFAQSVLQRDPSNFQARQDGVRAALQVNDTATAAQLAADAVALDPNDPAAWLLSANVARSGNDTRLALMDVQRAHELRAQQLGSDTGDGSLDSPIAVPQAPPVQATDLALLDGGASAQPAASAGGSYRTAQSFYTNPFRDQTGAAPASTPQPSTAAAQADPLTQQIDSTLATLQAKVAPQVAAYLDISGRTGETGLGGLGSLALPMEASFSPGGYGRLKFMARPTWLYSGRGGSEPLNQASLGTLAFNVTQPTATTQGFTGKGIDYQGATGLGLDLDYAYSWLEADLGSTPLGFNQTNIVGGITLTPRLTDTLNLRLIAERRAVTDSLLAYAGVRDPRTGNDMGGVTRNRVFGQLELQIGRGYWFAGAGVSKLTGENVKSNTETEAFGGLNYPVWTSNIDEVRLGLNLIYFGFDRNLGSFSLGQGGYFSPQSYFAALIPVSYSERLGRLSYMISGSAGVQTYHEKSSLWFPTNSLLQQELDVRALSIKNLQTGYDGQNQTGLSGSVRGEVQYEITPDFDIGGSASFERAGDFDQGEGLIYARYTFNGAR